MGSPPPTYREVDRMHAQADTDQGASALHHTLGYKPGQAAPGSEFKKLKDAVAASGAGTQLSGRRRNLNGAFNINQRGYVSGTFLNPNQYCLDRWRTFGGNPNRANNPTGIVLGGPNGTGWVSGGAISVLSGLTIPGLAGVTTAVRATFSAADATGLFNSPHTLTTIPVVAGETLVFSWYVRSNVAKTVTVSVQWQNSIPQGTTVLTGTPVALVANTWTRVSVSGVVPSGNVTAGIYSYQSSGNWAAGNTLDITGVLVQSGSTVNAFAMPPSVTFTAAPQGQMVTWAGNGTYLAHILERRDMEAATFTISWDGTATLFADVAGGFFPGPAKTSPATYTFNGTGDVYLLFTDGTLGNVQIEKGTVPTAFMWRSYGDELLLCCRYYVKWAGTYGAQIPIFGVQQLTTQAAANLTVPVPMRVSPTLTMADLCWSDYVGFESTVSGMTLPLQQALGTVFRPGVIFATAGAAFRPGGVYVRNFNSGAGIGFLALDAEI